MITHVASPTAIRTIDYFWKCEIFLVTTKTSFQMFMAPKHLTFLYPPPPLVFAAPSHLFSSSASVHLFFPSSPCPPPTCFTRMLTERISALASRIFILRNNNRDNTSFLLMCQELSFNIQCWHYRLRNESFIYKILCLTVKLTTVLLAYTCVCHCFRATRT